MEERQLQIDQLIVMQTQNTRENSEKEDQQEDGKQMEDETEFKTR